MSVRFSLKMRWKGLDRLKEVLDRAPHGLRKEMHEKSERAAREIVELAKQFAPVRTGRLRNSIRYRIAGFMSWIIEASVYYAGFVEFGTSKMAARPFMRPAIYIVSPKARREIGKQIFEYFAKELGKVM